MLHRNDVFRLYKSRRTIANRSATVLLPTKNSMKTMKKRQDIFNWFVQCKDKTVSHTEMYRSYWSQLLSGADSTLLCYRPVQAETLSRYHRWCLSSLTEAVAFYGSRFALLTYHRCCSNSLCYCKQIFPGYLALMDIEVLWMVQENFSWIREGVSRLAHVFDNVIRCHYTVDVISCNQLAVGLQVRLHSLCFF